LDSASTCAQAGGDRTTPQSDFVRRVNRDAERDEEGTVTPSSSPVNWLVGPVGRSLGSLHQDEWTGTGQELAATGSIAVYPVGGWWKSNGRADRASRPVRYALVVSLRTDRQDVDLYTPVANELRVPTAIVVE